MTIKVMVTGGAGYIGSNVCLALLRKGFEVVVLDDFSNSSPDTLGYVTNISGKPFHNYTVDICQDKIVREIFYIEKPQAVIHLAGKKSVVESLADPLKYYHNNVTGTQSILSAMQAVKVPHLVFSSSATLYKSQDKALSESDCLQPINPYGWSKLMAEKMCFDSAESGVFDVISLRYFNPLGTDESGLLADRPKGIPENLMPYIHKVLKQELPHLNIYGNDYDTRDGTAIRDYVHIQDLASAHIAALEYLMKQGSPGMCEAINIGSGTGQTVLEIVQGVEAANGVVLPYLFAPRRQGDAAISIADITKANTLLKWKPQAELRELCWLPI